MASFRAVQKAVTLPPTVRTLASGVPSAPLVNFKTKAPHDHHAHAHGHGATPRSDVPPTWAGGVRTSAAGLVSKSYVTRERTSASFFVGMFTGTCFRAPKTTSQTDRL